MTERILVIFDGSSNADRAIEEAMRRATEENKSLYILAIPSDTVTSPLMFQTKRLSEDMDTFLKAGHQFGIDVDGAAFTKRQRSPCFALGSRRTKSVN